MIKKKKKPLFKTCHFQQDGYKHNFECDRSLVEDNRFYRHSVKLVKYIRASVPYETAPQLV